MTRRRKRLIWILVAGVLVLGGGVAYSRNRSKATPVLTAKVATQDIVSKVTANGKIQAENKVEMSALVQGQVVNLAVREGDKVKKGDFLLQIDRNRAAAEEAGSSAALKASLSDRDSAKETTAQAERDFDRARRNYDARITSEADYQRAQSGLETARSAFGAAQNRVDQMRAGLSANRDTLSKTTVRAPIDGIVTTLRVKAGEVTVIGTMNNPGTQLLTVSDMSTVEAVLMVDETDTPTVQVGQKALLNIDAYPGRPFEGLVTEVGNSPILKDDPDLQGLTTTSDAINFKVKVKVQAPPPTIRPGFSVTADIITGVKEKVAAVPLAAVIVRDSPKGEKNEAGKLRTEQGVYALREGKAAFAPIKTGITGELMVEVVSGVPAGEEIVTGPFKALREIKDGDRVKKMSEKEKKAAEGQGAGTS
ncbi:MAG TPA: efflux RND transporter periplasmic adaptor subunit [Vicinamibacteria bacterium]|nr:efflux RND transporter periplasmic adaptor subunit [Vicinamibacteria bacterium]